MIGIINVYAFKTIFMKQFLLLIVALIFLASCSTSKTTQKAISSGNYDRAIEIAVSQLQKNKERKGNQEYIYMLEEAFDKATDRDNERIDYLYKDGNPEHLEEIYRLYVELNQRQELIKPLLPLYKYDSGNNAVFKFVNYNDEIINAKNEMSEYLYDKATASINTTDKNSLRAIYADLEYLDRVNPSFKDVRTLMNDVHERGTDYVHVLLQNTTDQIIPRRLEEDLLNFNTYGLNDLWTVYHSTPVDAIAYDFNLIIDFRSIFISPEQIREKELRKEKTITDGKEFVVDENGNRVKDSLGNEIQIDKVVKVKSVVREIRQFKSADVSANVQYIDNTTQQTIQTFPISSTFLFEHYYATHNGDVRALDEHYRGLIGLAVVPFPSN